MGRVADLPDALVAAVAVAAALLPYVLVARLLGRPAMRSADATPLTGAGVLDAYMRGVARVLEFPARALSGELGVWPRRAASALITAALVAGGVLAVSLLPDEDSNLSDRRPPPTITIPTFTTPTFSTATGPPIERGPP